MGHLTLISEDVIGALEHFPPDLRLVAAQYAPQPDWDDYVTGRYKETKRKDTSLLGGGKPVLAPGSRNNGTASWRVDEADNGSGAPPQPGEVQSNGASEMKGEFRRTSRTREASADFGTGILDDDDDEFSNAGPPHVSLASGVCCIVVTDLTRDFLKFAHYLAEEMQSSEQFGSSDDASDDEEEDGGWLAHSTFDLPPPPVSARQHDTDRRPLSSNGFTVRNFFSLTNVYHLYNFSQDYFVPTSSTSHEPYTNPFDDVCLIVIYHQLRYIYSVI